MPARLFLALLLIPTGALAAQSRNLSGTWVLNVSKSSFGNLPAPTSDSMVITRSGLMYHVDQYTTTAQGPTHMLSDWPASDGEVTNNVPGQDGAPGPTMHTVVKMHGDTATFSGEILIQGQQVATQTGREYLSPDRKTLVRNVDLVLAATGTPVHLTEVYERR